MNPSIIMHLNQSSLIKIIDKLTDNGNPKVSYGTVKNQHFSAVSFFNIRKTIMNENKFKIYFKSS